MQHGNTDHNRVQNSKTGNGAKPKQQRSNALPDFRFVRCDLDSVHRADLVAGISDGSLSVEMCYRLVERGFKLSIANDTRNRAFIATLSDSREGSPTRNMALSARGATIATAMCAVAYKHHFILMEDWLANESITPKDEWGLG